MKRRLILHVGAHRTATTSLQTFLNSNRAPLVGQGFLYPYKSRRHLDLFNALFDRTQDVAEVAADLDRRADTAQGDIHSIILSDEDICTRRDLSLLAGFSDRFDVQVIYALRRQDLWLESWYFQNIKWQWQKPFAHATFPEFMARREAFHWIDYDSYLAQIEALFGRENTLPVIYEKSQMPDGPVAAFCDRISLTERADFDDPQHMNPSFTPETSEFMRQLPLDQAKTGYRNILIRLCAHVSDVSRARGAKSSSLLMTADQRAGVLDAFAAGNARVAERFFGRETLFHDALPDPAAPLAQLALPDDSPTLVENFVSPFIEAAIERGANTLITEEYASPELARRVAPFLPGAPSDPALPAESAMLMKTHVVPMVEEMIRNAEARSFLRTGRRSLSRGAHVLQSLILPDPAVPGCPGLYFRPLQDMPVPHAETDGLHFDAGAGASFETWFNVFDSATWARTTDVDQLQFLLAGEGRFELSLWIRTEKDGTLCSMRREVTLGRVPVITHGLSPQVAPGTVWFSLRALTPGRIDRAEWQTSTPPGNAVSLALCVTTFHREQAVERTIERIRTRLGDDPELRLVVVDNGRSLPCRSERDGRIRVLHNPNLGGSGGFARGLIEARAAGATHCLFMDDDVSLHLDSVLRARAFLAHATDPGSAVSGAMIDAARPWYLWENGATYRQFCRPLEMGRDLRDPDDIHELIESSAKAPPAHFYGGWWFFAFPLARVEHLPFPFFVRGDDVSFSLANRFSPVTLPGVASFQENFTDKESPLTWYLDLRSHLAHQLSLPRFARGSAAACLKIIAWFTMRCLVRMHYDSLAALALAVEDVLDGPSHFAAQGDLAKRRAQIKALTNSEAWQPTPAVPHPRRRRLSPHVWPVRLIMKLTLNGHLLPGFARFGNHVILPANQRGWQRPVWGASRITQLNRDRSRCYVVTHSKSIAWQRLKQMSCLTLKLLRHHKRLRRTWQDGYAELTTEASWRGRLGLESSPCRSTPPSEDKPL